LLLFGLVFTGRGPEPPPDGPGQRAEGTGGSLYADPASCAGCHGGIAGTYALTGMARSFSRVGSTGDSLHGVARSGAFHHAQSERHYTIAEKNGALVQRRHQLGPGGAEVNVVEVAADYVIGSGNHARTLVSRAPDGRLMQLPLTWYTEGREWAMSPGYDRPAHLDFRRVIDDGCMSCHNGYPREPVRDDGTGPKFPAALPEGIDCQRCHGPGQAHVDAMAVGDLDRARRAIVNPSKLNRERQLEVCLQCHLEPTSRPLPFQLRRAGKSAFSYVPGTPLAETFFYFDHAPRSEFDDKFEIAGAAYRLAKSACFQASQMTCLTCHNPHDVPRGQAAVQHYTAVCASCHKAVHTAGPPRVAGAGPRATCLDCHMPRRRADDAVRVVLTDHFIQRIRPARDLLAPLEEAATLTARHYQGEVVPYYPKAPTPDPDTELYLALAQVQQGSNLRAGIPRLQKAVESHPLTPVEFYYELARAYAKAGNPGDAIRWSDAALARDATFAPALKELAAAATVLRQWDRATDGLRRALTLRPADTHAMTDLGNVYLQRQQVAEAVTTLERALSLDPNLPIARNTLGLAALAQGNAVRAEQEFREAIRIQPDLAEAHNNLANLLAGRQAYGEAAAHFEQAVRHDPNHAAAQHGYGLVLAVTQQSARALAALRSAARLQPSLERVHTDIADVLATMGRTTEAALEYRLALQANPDDFDAHFGLAELLILQGQPSAAIPHLRAAERSPDGALSEAARARLAAIR
jgi:predicted CXXCH cytochrome family protein